MSAKTAKRSGGGLEKRKNQRRSGLELLRVIAMLFIIMHHLILYTGSGIIDTPMDPSVRGCLFSGLCGFGKTGVAIFFLITGYFLCASKKRPNPKRVIPIVRQAIFYVLAGFALCWLVYPELIKISFPPVGVTSYFLSVFWSGCYWFIGAYALLILIAPQLKKMFDSLSDKDLTRLSIVIVTAVTLVSDVIRFTSTGVGITIFVFPTAFVFTLVGYTIRRREKDIKSLKWPIIAFLLGVLLIMITPILESIYAKNGLGDLTGIFSREQATGTMLASIGLFIIFSRMKWKNCFVNKIASYTLGVYLVHNSPFIAFGVMVAVTEWMRGIFYGSSIAVSVAALVGLTLGTFVASCLVEFARRLTVKIIVWFCTLEKDKTHSV